MIGYQAFATALEPHGIRAQWQNPGQMVISGQVGPIWPNGGNSFWLTRSGGAWYIATWNQRYWRVPEPDHLVALCVEFMDSSNIAAYMMPEPLMAKYQLVEIDYDGFEAIWDSRDTTKD